jgi:hypothetical protein
MSSLVGRAGRVAIAIPANGAGQVVVLAGGGSSTFLARSRNGAAVPEGMSVHIVEVEGDTLIVTESAVPAAGKS